MSTGTGFRILHSVREAVKWLLGPVLDSGARLSGKLASLVVPKALLDLLFRVHHKWTILDHGLSDRLPCHHQQPHTLAACKFMILGLELPYHE